MNDTILTQLKVLVERAVRPVRASCARKTSMRKELLAHVISVCEEESAKADDESIALQRTAERFGDPAALTKQLQDAVPGRDLAAAFLERIMGFPPAESALRRAVRNASLLFAAFAALFVPAMFVQGRLNEWPLLFGVPMLAFGFSQLNSGMHTALDPARRSWRRASALAAVSGILIPGVTWGVCVAMSGDGWESLRNVLPLVPAAIVLTPIVVLVMAHFTAIEIRWHKAWASLSIDTERKALT